MSHHSSLSSIGMTLKEIETLPTMSLEQTNDIQSPSNLLNGISSKGGFNTEDDASPRPVEGHRYSIE
jgi:hypothetical protein